MTAASESVARWVSVEAAARFLDLSADALRRTLERHAVRGAHDGVEARIDGVTGRKFGRLWRVKFSAAWTDSMDAVDSAPRENVRKGRPRSRP